MPCISIVAAENICPGLSNNLIFIKVGILMSDLNREIHWIFKRENSILQEAEDKLADQELSQNLLLPPYQKLTKEYGKLLKQNMKLIALGDKEQKYLFQIQSELKNILDNTGQGIFITNEKLCIQPNYSAECIRIFGQAVENRKFIDLIRPYNTEETVMLIEQVLSPAILLENDYSRNVMLMLLPEEIQYQEKFLSMSCRVITDEAQDKENSWFLFLLTDITEKKRLEGQMLEKQQLINAIIKIASDNYFFKSCAKAFMSFLSSEEAKLSGSLTYDKHTLQEILRQIHTFKGDFSVFELAEVVSSLHAAEEKLYKLISHNEKQDGGSVEAALTPEFLRTIFLNSIERLKRVIGASFFEFDRDEVAVDRKIFEKLVSEITALGGNADRITGPDRIKIGQVDLKSLFKSYPDYVVKLAERNGKSVAPFDIQSNSSLPVDEKKFSPFARALVHVFRNAVIHGLEDPSVRLQEGKEEYGRIGCSLWEENREIFIEISDDGQGIDIEKVKEKAWGFQTTEQGRMDLKDSDDLMEILTLDGFSTLDETDIYSGRGAGLAAVRRELELLGGRSYIKTTPGAGTVFGFRIMKG